MPNGPRYKASVIVPTFDRSKTVADTVASLAAQTMPKSEYEVIVVDDGSHDDTFEAVTALDSELNLKYVYQPDRGYRAARARNLGIALAEGDICIFVDAGNLAARAFVAEHVASHQAESSAVVEDDLCRAVAPWIYVFGGNFSARKLLVDQGGGFDEHYTSWGPDDLDIAFAMYSAGAKIVLNRKAAQIQTPHEKNPETRMASARKNAAYLHDKYKAHETDLFLRYGNRRMPILPSDPFPEI